MSLSTMSIALAMYTPPPGTLETFLIVLVGLFFLVFYASMYVDSEIYEKDPKHMNVANAEWWEILKCSKHSRLILPPDCFVHISEDIPAVAHETDSLLARSMSSIYSGIVKQMKNKASRESSSTVIDAIIRGNKKFDPAKIPLDCTPLLCFINSRSGGNQGKAVMSLLKRLLNPIQVFDLARVDPAGVLKAYTGANLPSLRVLAAGGDGTVGWILKAVEDLPHDLRPPVAILPLGTGNDLSRVLGWGVTADVGGLPDLLAQIQRASVVMLDRWEMTIRTDKSSTNNVKKPEEKNKKVLMFNNYVGVGVDAQIVLGFHTAREKSPLWFISQFGNKLWYGLMGGREIWRRNCAGLPSYLELSVDGTTIMLPEGTEGIIFSNIPSYGGGAKLWHTDPDQIPPNDNNDDQLQQQQQQFNEHIDCSSQASSFSFSVQVGAPGPGGDDIAAIGRGFAPGAAAAGGAGKGLLRNRKRRRRNNNNNNKNSSTSSSSNLLAKQQQGPRLLSSSSNVPYSSSCCSSANTNTTTTTTASSAAASRAVVWKDDSIQDGCLEVVAVTGSLHLARIKVGLARATRLYQGAPQTGFEMKLKRRSPIQFDGEPFDQEPCTVTIQRAGKAMMLKRTAAGADTDVAVDVIEWAQRVGHLTREQRTLLLLELSTRLESRERAKAAVDAYGVVDEHSVDAQLRSRLSMTGLRYDVLSDDEPDIDDDDHDYDDVSRRRTAAPGSAAKRRAVATAASNNKNITTANSNTSSGAFSPGTLSTTSVDDWETVLRTF